MHMGDANAHQVVHGQGQALQPVLVIGGSLILLLVLVIGGVQVGSRARKQALTAHVHSAKLSDLPVGKPNEGRDLFDDIPEDEK